MPKKKSRKEKKEDVCEIFEIEKKGEEKIIEKCGCEPIKSASKEEIEHQNKTLKNILIVVGIIILAVIIGSVINYKNSHFEYKGINYDKVREGDLIFYKTTFPIYYNGNPATYNIYLRNDPRKLEKVPFEGEIIFADDMVINATDSFNCEGDGVIAVANLVKIRDVLGINIMKDDKVGCDSDGKYMFVRLLPGNETKIVHNYPKCYDLYINDCEILEVTEKFMVEMFAKVSDQL